MSRPKAAWGRYQSWRYDKWGAVLNFTSSRKGPKPYKSGNPRASHGFSGLTTSKCGQTIRLLCSAVSSCLAVMSIAVVLYFIACWFCWVRANDQRIDTDLDREVAYRNAQKPWRP